MRFNFHDEHSVVAPTEEDPFLGQALWCFPERTPGRVELARQEVFVDLLSGADGPLDDLFTQLICDQLRRGPSFRHKLSFPSRP